jgi:hypothetical protein
MKYPQSEHQYLTKLSKLFDEWSKQKVSFENYSSQDFVFDGFYPHYYSQKIKILFVGRESRGLSGCNYIEVLHKCYRETKQVGERPLNGSKFHRLMLYIAYSLNNQYAEWDDVPNAAIIGDNFAIESGVSFAFMNLSKFSNERSSWQTINELLNESVRASSSHINYIKEEIKILIPDVIVTMNLGEKISLLGENLSELEKNDKVHAYRIRIGDRFSLLLDTYHFSAPNKNDRDYFFDPVKLTTLKYSKVFSD